MTNQQKLTKLIEIAVENGYETLIFRPKERVVSLLIGDMYAVAGLLFSHDFAKAIWGEWKNDEQAWDEDCYSPMNISRWQHHLQQAVISDDPLEYYWENK